MSTTITTIIIGLLSAFFLFAGSIKVFGWQKMIFETQLAMMKKYGLNRQILGVIGTAELIASIMIWFQGSLIGAVGAGIILATSIGALGFHFIYDTWREAVPAAITAPLSAFVLWMGRDSILDFIGLPGIF